MWSQLISWLMQPCVTSGSDDDEGARVFPSHAAMAFLIGGEIGVQPFLSQALTQRARDEDTETLP